jgi:hypothetical protein
LTYVVLRNDDQDCVELDIEAITEVTAEKISEKTAVVTAESRIRCLVLSAVTSRRKEQEDSNEWV